MDNTKYLGMPIRSFNNCIKTHLSDVSKSFLCMEKGCIFNGNYFDFKSTRLTSNFALIEKVIDDIPLHINQISEEDIFFALVFRNRIECYIIDYQFFKKSGIKLTEQHKNGSRQCDTSYHQILKYARHTWTIK